MSATVQSSDGSRVYEVTDPGTATAGCECVHFIRGNTCKHIVKVQLLATEVIQEASTWFMTLGLPCGLLSSKLYRRMVCHATKVPCALQLECSKSSVKLSTFGLNRFLSADFDFQSPWYCRFTKRSAIRNRSFSLLLYR